MSSKLPFVSSNIPRDLRAFIDRVRELITGSGDEKLVTVGDLVSGGIASKGAGGTLISPPADARPPTTATGLTASGAIQNIVVTWAEPLYAGHSHTEVWGAATDNLGEAVQVGMTPGAVFVDPVGPSVVRYYWVRFVNILGAQGAFNAVAGTRGETGPAVDYLLETLAGQITESELYVDLNGRIDEIDGGPGGTTGLLSKYTVKVDLAGHVAGYGIAATDNTGTPTSSFGVRADQFWVAPPSTVSPTAPTTNLYVGYVWVDSSVTPNITKYYNGSTWQTTQVKSAIPFVVQTSPATVNGVAVPAGVYIDAAYIKNGTITNAKIGDAAIDDAKIVTLTAAKITAGSISTGSYIQSTGFISGSQGWRISGDGVAEFGAASIRGQITAAQIDSRGLSIKDASGNIILAAGTPLTTAYISGLGSFATLSQLTAANIGTYMASAAITNAYIGTAAVTTLKIGANAVTVPVRFSFGTANLTGTTTFSGSFTLPDAANVLVIVSATLPNDEAYYLNDAGSGYYLQTSSNSSRYFPGSVASLFGITIDGTLVLDEAPNHGFGYLLSASGSKYISSGGTKNFSVTFEPLRVDSVVSYEYSGMRPRNVIVYVLAAAR